MVFTYKMLKRVCALPGGYLSLLVTLRHARVLGRGYCKGKCGFFMFAWSLSVCAYLGAARWQASLLPFVRMVVCEHVLLFTCDLATFACVSCRQAPAVCGSAFSFLAPCCPTAAAACPGVYRFCRFACTQTARRLRADCTQRGQSPQSCMEASDGLEHM